MLFFISLCLWFFHLAVRKSFPFFVIRLPHAFLNFVAISHCWLGCLVQRDGKKRCLARFMWTEDPLTAEAPTTYWKIMEFQIGKSQVSLYVYFLCAKLVGKMLTLIRLDCTTCTCNHGCYINSEAGGTKESLSCHPKADSEITLKSVTLNLCQTRS